MIKTITDAGIDLVAPVQIVSNTAGLVLGCCKEVLAWMPDNSVDAIVCDPPYGLNFMGKHWDYDVPDVETWAECLRVLKPGGHLLAFAGTRTQHRMCVNIEDAGFQIIDMIAWVHGQGFPKSLDVSKAIDKAAGAEREKVRIDASQVRNPKASGGGRDGTEGATRPWIEKALEVGYHEKDSDDPATDAARQWQGWGTALKPALEPITVARKPFKGTVAENVLQYGTGAINVDGCRVEGEGGKKWDTPRGGIWSTDSEAKAKLVDSGVGRWPANLIHDGSEEVVALAGEQARFFYCAKASKRDRDEGLEGFEVRRTGGMRATVDGPMLTGSGNERTTARANSHPTVKPTDLMRYLCRLVTPPGGIVLDPFMGSGSTGKAAVLEGFQFIGIEREAEYIDIAAARILHAVGGDLL